MSATPASPPRRPSRAVVAAAVLVAAVAIALFLVLRADSGGGRGERADAGCRALVDAVVTRRPPAGGGEMDAGGGEADRGGEPGRDGESSAERDNPAGEGDDPGTERAREACFRRKPETFSELSAANEQIVARGGFDTRADEAAARAARTAQVSAKRTIAGTAGSWKPLGSGPLIANDPAYPSTDGEGFGELGGRVSDYAYDQGHRRVFAAVASGGVWQSDDMGKSWHSIGDALPTQTVGSVAYTTAGGGQGTLVAVTGDNAFGGQTFGGAGVFWSNDDGRTWHKAAGAPSGAQGFKAAVDPGNPSVVYAATGFGLYRSTDAGRGFTNVDLPTGACHGDSLRKNCFLANVVTDVVVQGKDGFGHRGGAVLAVVGWRSGLKKNDDGTVQSPANGLYRSDTGVPGSFKKLAVGGTTGFPAQANIGRVEMGGADGAGQNHGYVYAIVQDAALFNSGKLEGLDTGLDGDPLGLGINPLASPTNLNGIYVSSDFGSHWTQMASRLQMLLPTSGSALAQLTPLGFGPGIQTWYDEWIKPSPVATGPGGVPTQLAFGMEELYANTLPLPQGGPSTFTAVGPYTAGGGLCLLVLAEPLCSAKQKSAPGYTTHPDQHAGLWIPDGKGGATLFAGNDGGAYTQHVAKGASLTQAGFGLGANHGFHTLLPYGVSMAKDGTVFAGLQDNGELRIDPKTGKQNETYGGDGVFTQVDPDHSSTVFEETPEAGVNASTDGGKSWNDVSPVLDNASFYAPLVMDSANAKHILSAGREIAETTAGTATSGTTDAADRPSAGGWIRVFDLGTYKHPGVPVASDPNSGAPVVAKGDVQNQASALANHGAAIYAGYCGGCDPVRDGGRFHAGLATNVGGSKPPKTGTADGWHLVPAKGLPQRLITSVTIDPRNDKTVFVTLGTSTLRPYVPPGGLGVDGTSSAGGHVYKSTDGGLSFKDISGTIRKLPALWSVLHGRQLIVATTVGVWAAKGTNGGRYELLGKNLPAAPVYSMEVSPRNGNQLVAASLGRGVQLYTFKNPPGSSRCTDRRAPRTLISRRSAVTATGVAIRGTARDRGCTKRPRTRRDRGGVRRVQVSIALRVGTRCRFLGARGRLGHARSCAKPVLLRARGTTTWRLTRKANLPAGRYVVRSLATDLRGHREKGTRPDNRINRRVR